MDSLTALGLIAGACTTFSFVPQLLKIWKSKSTHDISLAMYAVISTGVLLWLVYGLLVRDVPIITVGILAFKLKYR